MTTSIRFVMDFSRTICAGDHWSSRRSLVVPGPSKHVSARRSVVVRSGGSPCPPGQGIRGLIQWCDFHEAPDLLWADGAAELMTSRPQTLDRDRQGECDLRTPKAHGFQDLAALSDAHRPLRRPENAVRGPPPGGPVSPTASDPTPSCRPLAPAQSTCRLVGHRC